MPYYLSPVANDQQCNANGVPLSGGKVYTYVAGTTTPAPTYTDSTTGTQQANPIILNSLGLSASPIWMQGGTSLKFVIQDSTGVTIRTVDNVAGVNDTTNAASEWVETGFTPTYINATQFSVVGDQTPTLQVNRRVRTKNTAGYIYGRISAAVYSAGITTVTVVNDSGTLDSGLSLVATGFLSYSPTSLPYGVYAGAGANNDITALLNSGGIQVATRTDVASAATVSLTGNPDDIRITGTTTITGFTAAAGRVVRVVFGGSLTLTNNASIVTQTGANIVTQAGDTCILRATAANTVEVLSYARISQPTLFGMVNVSGTSNDFTGIPSWAKEIVIMFDGVSTNGTSNPLIQLGDSGGVENAGYKASSSLLTTGVSTANYTTGFGIDTSLASNTLNGSITLTLMDAATNKWVISGVLNTEANTLTVTVAGTKTLSPGPLDRIRLTTLAGTDTFDAGSINIYVK